MLNSNKAEIYLRLRICDVTFRGFPSTGSLRASHFHRTSCNFDFHARYARKSRKLRAYSRARVKLRTGYWISFLKTFVTAARSANPVGFEVDSALHKRITYQWTDSVENLYARCILYFRRLPRRSKNSPYEWTSFIKFSYKRLNFQMRNGKIIAKVEFVYTNTYNQWLGDQVAWNVHITDMLQLNWTDYN